MCPCGHHSVWTWPTHERNEQMIGCPKDIKRASQCKTLVHQTARHNAHYQYFALALNFQTQKISNKTPNTLANVSSQHIPGQASHVCDTHFLWNTIKFSWHTTPAISVCQHRPEKHTRHHQSSQSQTEPQLLLYAPKLVQLFAEVVNTQAHMSLSTQHPSLNHEYEVMAQPVHSHMCQNCSHVCAAVFTAA